MNVSDSSSKPVSSDLVSSDVSVRVALAATPRLSKDVFEVLSRDLDVSVRLQVAHNISAPRQVLSRLLSDVSSKVRAAAEENPSTSTSDLVSPKFMFA